MLDHISVCVCTYKRPHLLLRLLRSLEGQETRDRFTYSAVVVDNDVKRSAQSTVKNFIKFAKIPVRYYNEPIQNISLARNMAIAMADGTHLAFIDDDEFPGEEWLFHLHSACRRFRADCVLGPVEPYYETEPPGWILKGRMCERNHFETGTLIKDLEDTRTGNVLVLKESCRGKEGPFDPSRGRSGGEDYEFFQWMMKMGRSICWCDEAPVYESVPAERMKRSYFLKRGLLRGSLTSKDEQVISLGTVKSVIAVCLYTAALPLLAFLGQHLFMKYLMKECDHLGKLFGLCGVMLMRERTF